MYRCHLGLICPSGDIGMRVEGEERKWKEGEFLIFDSMRPHTVWQDMIAYFEQRDPQQIERATNNPKRKMALIFRSYLGLSSRWSNTGEPGREID